MKQKHKIMKEVESNNQRKLNQIERNRTKNEQTNKERKKERKGKN